jgi:hypothetical protein
MAFSKKDVDFVFFNIAKRKCQCCGKELVYENRDIGSRSAWHAHHIRPRSVKVDDSILNIAILCINNPENCHLKCAHGGAYPTHNLPPDWGKSHSLRRCWFKTGKGQCEVKFIAGNRRLYCKRHK